MIYATQVLAAFREGLDTASIAQRFGITELQALRLLHEARVFRTDYFRMPATSSKGAAKGARASKLARERKPVTLPTLKFLEGEQ